MKKWIGLFLIVAFLAYFAVCSVSMVWEVRSRPTVPDATQATYQLRIRATREIILAKSVTVKGTVEGKRIYTIKGYWESVKGNFIYRDATVPLDEKVFGIIDMARR